MEEGKLVSLVEKRNNKAVAIWLLIGVAMVVVQIALGGITRLTGSGLSITEWDVVTGALPPLSQQAWMAEFEKYQQTPQFRLLNSDFDLSQFKSIFFWEWFHRFWARLLGVVFAIGFGYFLLTKKFQRHMIRPLVVLFVLGALQGAVGWIMVASGLTGDAVYVKPTRLALHFIFALGLLCYTLWFALQLLVHDSQRRHLPAALRIIWIILSLLTLQLMYGALMAGHKAASAAPTWPDINGSVFSPPGLYNPAHGLTNFIDNKITIHFMHRGLAYLLLVLTLLFSWRFSKTAATPLQKKIAWWPAMLVTAQVVLGILAVLQSTGIVPGHWGGFEWLAQTHQLVGMLYLLVMVLMLYVTTPSLAKR